MPVRTKGHHCQLPATPWVRTKLVTRLGVSLENVEATIDRPASHQSTERPDAKNSEVSFEERRANQRAGRKQTAIEARAMAQSTGWRCMGLAGNPRLGSWHRGLSN